MTPFAMRKRDCIWFHDIRHDNACSSSRFSRITWSSAAPIPVGLCARLSMSALMDSNKRYKARGLIGPHSLVSRELALIHVEALPKAS